MKTLPADKAGIKRRHPTGSGPGPRQPNVATRARQQARGAAMYEGRYHIASEGRKCGIIHFSI